MRLQRSKQGGMGIIILLFVITMIAVAAAVGLSTYQMTEERTKIDKAASQMRHILDAASAYYLDNKAWPQNMGQTDFKSYLPDAITLNPWGTGYILCVVASPLNPDNPGVQVQTTLSDNNLAMRLASRLPGGVTASNAVQGCVGGTSGTIAISQIGLPGQALVPVQKPPPPLDLKVLGTVDVVEIKTVAIKPGSKPPVAEATQTASVTVDCPKPYNQISGVYFWRKNSTIGQTGGIFNPATGLFNTETLSPVDLTTDCSPQGPAEQYSCTIQISATQTSTDDAEFSPSQPLDLAYLGICELPPA